jgi:cytidine deaminase
MNLQLDHPQSDRPDVYIGLVGAAGTDLQSVKTQLKAQFAAVNYDTIEVKMSALIGLFAKVDTRQLPENDRIETLMNAGDEIRRASGRGDGVISLATAFIRSRRRLEGADDVPANRGATVFIIDSLKTPAEVRTLAAVYGRNFITVSVYSPLSRRAEKLANRIAASTGSTVQSEHIETAKALISRDDHRDATQFSQNVRDTFPLADFFVNAEFPLETQIKRLVDLLFGEPFATPTTDEFAMFVAKAASLRSSDLSRQVGAVIVGPDGAIVATGCNEVPYPGGGFFAEDSGLSKDNRDYTVEYDPNASQIQDTVVEFVSALRKSGALKDDQPPRSDEEIARSLMHGPDRSVFSETRVRNLIEFGRVVHAEMTAIAEAARVGRPVAGATLYCTTFPCHICARHIIAVGVMKVVFIEPYPKSLTKTLYSREITTDDEEGRLDRTVTFKPFHGVSPSLYPRVFEYRPRKNAAGAIVRWIGSEAIPREFSTGVANATLEKKLSGMVDEIHAKYHNGATGAASGA